MLESTVPLVDALLDICDNWATNRSKDPNTKVGALVYDKHGGIHLGYNGFPQGIADLEDRWKRPTKYAYVRHAEENAIIKALRAGVEMSTSTLYCTHKPCHRCAGLIIQAGIREVVYSKVYDDGPLTDELFQEAGINVRHHG